LASVLKKFENPTYIDVGGFTTESLSLDRFNHLMNYFNYTGCKLINLSKLDLLTMTEYQNYLSQEIKVISTNIISNIPSINKVATLDLLFHNKGYSETTKIGFLGISENRRLVGYWKQNVTVQPANQAIDKGIRMLQKEKPDLIFLLYNSNINNLRRDLRNIEGHIDFVIGSYGRYATDKIIYKENVPVVFIGEMGERLGEVVINKIHGRYYYEYNKWDIISTIPEDGSLISINHVRSHEE